MDDLETTNDLLQRILQSLDRGRLGLINDPPGRRTIFANRVRAPDGVCWYFWDKDTQQPVPIEETALRGQLTDLVIYEKASPEGTSVKLRITLACGWAQYDVETSLYATSGCGLLSGLLEAGDAVAEGAITIGVRPADKEEVLFLDVYTDEGGLQINDDPIVAGDQDRALGAVKKVRTAIGLDPDPWTDRFDPSSAETGQPPESAGGAPPQQPPPRGETPDADDSARFNVPDVRENGTTSIEGLPDELVSTIAELPVHVQEAIKVRHHELQKLGSEELDEAIQECRDEVESWPSRFGEVAESVLDEHEKRVFEPDDELPF